MCNAVCDSVNDKCENTTNRYLKLVMRNSSKEGENNRILVNTSQQLFQATNPIKRGGKIGGRQPRGHRNIVEDPDDDDILSSKLVDGIKSENKYLL
ncbi:CLUMA_CG018362, isoform A [Clunio marinus]|uniref:CLUMA_CG018362, isoform A n=1 Tax=Clunio marinus TaxID=568069 RepID=A0A1J1J2Q6_9DIPT|nr:CLUMA_CG018362, isoform A [Clunio marinus]